MDAATAPADGLAPQVGREPAARRFQRINGGRAYSSHDLDYAIKGFSRMPTGRHLGHRGPSGVDKARTARAVAEAAGPSPPSSQTCGRLA